MRARFVNESLKHSEVQDIVNKLRLLSSYDKKDRLPCKKEIPDNKCKEAETLLKRLYDGSLPKWWTSGKFFIDENLNINESIKHLTGRSKEELVKQSGGRPDAIFKRSRKNSDDTSLAGEITTSYKTLEKLFGKH